MKIAVADTSILIRLNKGNVIDCLGKIFNKIYISKAVQNELKEGNSLDIIKRPFFYERKINKELQIRIGKGERQTISLAIELGSHYILTDDKKAIKKALDYNLIALMSLDILKIAKIKGYITNVREIIKLMKLKGEGIEDKLVNYIFKDINI